ncbi:HINT domain-containing protein (plasmid) [Deinococcus taeanensis]|uniref:polymorphic toxin-type HINT domain-containing protein n=1 Tax=Deinococcus taeanensis TaxID=2737050 RepID=UPI001CDC20F7|nr:polymorphic toxin-type HINT domain-containing protein [Deinococcus taeanensis]UBV44770.1 HINT domain-containing protein [Deinococcus taeanensis]
MASIFEHSTYVTERSDTQPRPKPEGHEDLSDKWVGAGHLKIGDKVKQADGTIGLVANVINVQKAKEMFNLTISEAHTYYVGQAGWLVHNANGPDCGSLVPKILDGLQPYTARMSKGLSQYEKLGGFNAAKADFATLLEKYGIDASKVSVKADGDVMVVRVNNRGDVLIVRNRSGSLTGGLPILEHQVNGESILKIRYR